MSQDQITELELNINQAQEFIELNNCLVRLQSNPDFVKVINEKYLKDEAVRLVHLKADPALQEADKQNDIDKDIDAIGRLLQFFRAVEFMGGQARAAIEADREMIAEIEGEMDGENS